MNHSSSRLEWLDLFRGLAAIVVALFHYKTYLGIEWIGFGFIAVDLFFVLSGIVLTLRYADAIASGMPFRDFAAQRMKRLYPMVLIAASFVAILNLIGLPASANPQYVTASNTSVWHLFAVVPSLETTGVMFPANVPMWSLLAELVCNLLWFGVMRLGQHKAMVLATSLAGAIYFLMVRHYGTINIGWQAGGDQQFGGLMRACFWFGMGYFLARARSNLTSHVGFVGLVFALSLVISVVDPSTAAYVVAEFWGMCLLACLLNYRAPSVRLSVVAELLGKASFPLYLIHAPAGRVVALVNFDGLVWHWMAVAVVVGWLTFLATALNERIVAWVGRHLVMTSTSAAATT